MIDVELRISNEEKRKKGYSWHLNHTTFIHFWKLLNLVQFTGWTDSFK